MVISDEIWRSAPLRGTHTCKNPHIYIELSPRILFFIYLACSLNLSHAHFLTRTQPEPPSTSPCWPNSSSYWSSRHHPEPLFGLLSRGSRQPISLPFSKCQHIWVDGCAWPLYRQDYYSQKQVVISIYSKVDSSHYCTSQSQSYDITTALLDGCSVIPEHINVNIETVHQNSSRVLSR